MSDIYIEYLPNTGNPQFDLAAKRIIDLLRTYISSFDTNEVTGGDSHDHSGSVGYKRKIVNIGDWDMVATLAVNVAHGVTASKIRNVSGIVIDDAATYYYPIASTGGATVLDLFVSYWDATNVGLVRKAGGVFDHTDFDSTSYNRGWVVVEYID
jgi:hypothetical protein